MLFNSLDFFIFLPLFFICYWFIFNKNIRNQNVLVLVASYIFYGWWDWRFLGLIILSTIVDFIIGISIGDQTDAKKKKLLLLISLFTNLGLLAFFKYYNFFLDSFVEAFTFFGYNISKGSINLILPVGISFYTFQTLSYTIDVYRKKIEPTKDLIAFGAYVSFFPQLVAGPIERATNFLPQFFKKREFEYSNAMNGLRQILFGFFKKVVIADNCGIVVDIIFANHSEYSGSTLLIGALLFSFQIYLRLFRVFRYCNWSRYDCLASN